MNWLRRQHGRAQRVLQGLVLGIILLIATAPGAQAQEARGSITGRVIVNMESRLVRMTADHWS